MPRSGTIKGAPGFTWAVESHDVVRGEACVVVPVSDIERLSNEELGHFIRYAKHAAELCRAIHDAEYILESAKGLTPTAIARRFTHADLEPILPFAGEDLIINQTITLLQQAFYAANKVKVIRSEVSANHNNLFMAIGKRDGFDCAICGDASTTLEIDHVYPVSKGGGNALDNLQLLCRNCNREKGAKV